MVPFVLLALSIVSVWIRRDIKIWGGLLLAALVLGYTHDSIGILGLAFVLVWALLWNDYSIRRSFVFFWIIVAASFAFKFHLLPGFPTMRFPNGLILSFDSPIVGLFPLALVVPLTKAKEWVKVLKGFWLTVLGIVAMAGVALAVGAVFPHINDVSPWRYASGLILVAAAEEGFYRGFVLHELLRMTNKWVALVASALIFTLAHLYWKPELMAFVFLAGLLYGGVYMISRRVESSILCHFLLNAIHMTFFSY